MKRRFIQNRRLAFQALRCCSQNLWVNENPSLKRASSLKTDDPQFLLRLRPKADALHLTGRIHLLPNVSKTTIPKQLPVSLELDDHRLGMVDQLLTNLLDNAEWDEMVDHNRVENPDNLVVVKSLSNATIVDEVPRDTSFTYGGEHEQTAN